MGSEELAYYEWVEQDADLPSSSLRCEVMTGQGVRTLLVAAVEHRCSRCRGVIARGVVFTRDLLPECVLCLPVCPLPMRPRLAVARYVEGKRERIKSA